MWGNLPIPVWFNFSSLQAAGYSWNAPALPRDVPVETHCCPEGQAQISLCFDLAVEEEEEEVWCRSISLSFGTRPWECDWVWLFAIYVTFGKLFNFSEPQFPYL